LGVTRLIAPVSNVNDAINAGRQLLDQAWIDETYCERD
jgi:hypothetical protein